MRHNPTSSPCMGAGRGRWQGGGDEDDRVGEQPSERERECGDGVHTVKGKLSVDRELGAGAGPGEEGRRTVGGGGREGKGRKEGRQLMRGGRKLIRLKSSQGPRVYHQLLMQAMQMHVCKGGPFDSTDIGQRSMLTEKPTYLVFLTCSKPSTCPIASRVGISTNRSAHA